MICSFERQPEFWARAERKNIREEDALKNIWKEFESDTAKVDLLLILNRLSQFIGKKINP